MRTDRKPGLFLLLYGCLLLLPLWQLNLIESTEARYGEIAREMLVSGNFLEPTFNGIFHFHKPPLPYWGMAAGMAIFGVNDFGVRFFGVVAALVAVFFLHRTAMVILKDRDRAFAAATVLASSLLFLAISRTVSTDIYLTCCVLGAQYFLFNQAYGARSTGNVTGYAVFVGFGFMVKGPVIFLFTLLPQLAAKLVDHQHRRLFTFREILLGLCCFLVLSLPWYLAVIANHPELLAYFTKTQTVDRVATERFARNKPFWYFLLLFPATFLPYTIPLLRSVPRWREYPPMVRALCLYLLLPLVVFCLAKSKLPPYILPFYGTAALLAVYAYHEFRSIWDDRLIFLVLLLMAAAIGCAGFVSPPLQPLRLPLAVAGLGAMVVCFRLRQQWGREHAVQFAGYVIIAIAVVAYLALPWQLDRMKAYRPLAEKMNSLDPQRQVPVIVYKAFLPSISFYRQELAIMAMGREREVMFEKNDAYRRCYVQTVPELLARTAGCPRLFVVTEPKDIDEFVRTTSFACSELLARKRYTAYDCRLTMPAR